MICIRGIPHSPKSSVPLELPEVVLRCPVERSVGLAVDVGGDVLEVDAVDEPGLDGARSARRLLAICVQSQG